MEHNKAKEYWEKNISEWGKFYHEIAHSDEKLDAPGWLTPLYRRFITPIEAKVMTERFRLTIDFIDRFVVSKTVAVDIGCGTGIFTVEMLKRGAFVKAVDIAESSLRLTRSLVEDLVPDATHRVEYLQVDVSQQRLPESDVALAMGVTPYVEDLGSFYENILPTTNVLYCLILDPYNWANLVRRFLPFLNVRHLHWFDRRLVDSLLAKHNWRLISRRNLGTGFLDIAVGPGYRATPLFPEPRSSQQ